MLALKDPAQVQKILPSALEKIKMFLEEHSLADDERKRAEEALKNSEARLRLIAQAGRIGFFEYNASNDTTYWSQEHYELFGYKPGSTVSWQRWLQGVHPEDRGRVVENAASLLERARLEGLVQGHKDEYRFIRSDGSVVWLEADLSVDMVGGETIIRGSVRDITERKRAERALLESQARFRSVLDNTQDIIVRMNLQTGCYDFVSPSVEALVGYSPDEFLAMDEQTALEMIHPDDLPVLRDAMVRSEETGKAKAEYRQRTKSGVYIWVSNRMSVVKDGSGRPSYRISSIRDITERKKAEGALRQSHERYAATHDHAPVAIALFTLPEGVIIEVNAAWERFSECPREEAIGKTTVQLGLTGDPEARDRMYAELLAKGFVHNWEMAYKTRSGRDRLGIFNFDRVEIDGQAYHLGTIIDIIEHKRAEEALKESEERYRLLFEQANDGIVVHKLSTDREESKFIQVNDVVCWMLGYTREEMQQLSPLDIQDKEDLADVPAEVKAMFERRE